MPRSLINLSVLFATSNVMALWKKTTIIYWIDSVLFISTLIIPAHKATWPWLTTTGIRAGTEWSECISPHRVWECANFSFISFKFSILYLYFQNFVSYCALRPFQMGCLIEFLCQSETVQISHWFPKKGTKIMTDSGRWQCSGTDCTVLTDHVGSNSVPNVAVTGTIVSTVN